MKVIQRREMLFIAPRNDCVQGILESGVHVLVCVQNTSHFVF